MSVWLGLAIALSSFIGTHLYRRAWLRFKHDGTVPMGYGAFLAVAVLFAALHTGVQPAVTLACAIICGVTIVYWLDDAFGLGVRFRFLLQMATGAGLGYIELSQTFQDNPVLLALMGLAAAVLNIGLTNVVNFYDGADLNLATLMVLTAGTLFCVASADLALSPIAVAILAFVIPFAIVNRKPKTLYFGDSGCFAFASVLTAGAILIIRDGDTRAALAAAPMALPVFDAVYVIALRLARQEDLLSRNYLHLYQQLQSKYAGFFYLAPQAVIAFAVLAIATLLTVAAVPAFIALALSIVVVTPTLYAAWRWVFLR